LESWKITFQSSNLPVMRSQLFFSFGLEFNDFNAPVVAARRADLMGQARFVAFRAGNHIAGHKCVVAAAPAFAALA
jgi:hypothetical protein